MSKTNIFLCRWYRRLGCFTAWLRTQPRIRSEERDLTRVWTRLVTEIKTVHVGVRPVLEFDPPLPRPTAQRKYSEPELVRICGQTEFKTDAPEEACHYKGDQMGDHYRWLDTFFTEPLCRRCDHSPGTRNNKPLTLTKVEYPYDGAFGGISSAHRRIFDVFSAEFLARLTSEERQRLRFLPTIYRKGRRLFFELIGPPGPPFVAAVGLDTDGWHCEACGHKYWHCSISGPLGYLDMSWYVPKGSLPKPLPGLFTIGTPPDIRLCATSARWSELMRKQTGIRGCSSEPVGVVSDDEAIFPEQIPTFPPWQNVRPWE